jgi:hypothetical protein
VICPLWAVGVQADKVETSWQYSAAEVERMMKLHFEGDGQEDQLGGGRGDHRGDGPNHAALAGARKGRPSPKRIPLKVCEEVLRLYQERYADFNVRHFHEKLR